MSASQRQDEPADGSRPDPAATLSESEANELLSIAGGAVDGAARLLVRASSGR